MKSWFPIVLIVFISNCINAQVTAGVPDPIILCDVNNPGDETEVFDLTIREGQIINGQSNVVVTYHTTSGDALSGTNPYPNPMALTNIANPQVVFVRLQSTAGQGWDVTTLDLIVPLIPVVAAVPDDIILNEGDNDGSAIFDLTMNESQALGSQDPFRFQFKYFRIEADAIADENRIEDPENFQNTANPQTIFVRMAPLEDQCDFEIYSFTIETDGILGILDLDLNHCSIYPNPASNMVTVSFNETVSSVHVILYDMLGKRIFSETISVNNGQSAIDVSTLPKSMYYLSITSEAQTIVKKFIKN
ncbi:T9SS type A sorting domain-containing protein [uncultured Altibacter sp.]|mgnify:CR=1 FL=1|uniref:T9SS type A sorting domain-containing protein n=1 Tax=uncultured Altibacter sp. TaxID=2506933 RepID=UPI0030DC9DC0